MESHTFLIQIVVILLAARVVGEIAAYFKAPSVIGELLAGILIGPSVLGLIEISPSIHLLGQIGVVLLLFEVGLETDIGRLSAAGLKAFVIAVGGVILPLALGFAVSFYLFQLNLLTSLFVGCTLTATSIGITLRVLRDLKRQNSHEAQMILGAAVIDDIIGIILLSLLFDFSTKGEINLLSAGESIFFVVLFFLCAPPAAKFISQLIGKWDKRCEIPGLLPTTIISLILLFAWVAYYIGAPELLGGFAVGLGLSKHFPFPIKAFTEESANFNHRVEEQMKPLVHFFSPIFFVAIGLSLNLRQVDWHSSFIWLLTGSVLLIAIISKLLAAFFITKETFLTKLIVGTAMIPRGEVGLIFANIGVELLVFKDDTYAAMILIIALSTLVPPFFLRWLYRLKDEADQPRESRQSL
jgi:Kef-type K+ transport system membrane component KefB